MKKFLLFLGGFASGVILTIVVLFFIGKASASNLARLWMYSHTKFSKL